MLNPIRNKNPQRFRQRQSAQGKRQKPRASPEISHRPELNPDAWSRSLPRNHDASIADSTIRGISRNQDQINENQADSPGTGMISLVSLQFDRKGLRDKGSDLGGLFLGDSSRYRPNFSANTELESGGESIYIAGAEVAILTRNVDRAIVLGHDNILAGSRPYGRVWCGWICGYLSLYKILACCTEGTSFATRSGPTGISV